MLRYIIQRMLLMVPTLLGVAVLCFFMLRLMPGDPVQMMMDGANVSKTVIDAERARLGLDQPLYVQFFRWIGAALTGDFGYSIAYKISATELILSRLWNTFVLSLAATVLGKVDGLNLSPERLALG